MGDVVTGQLGAEGRYWQALREGHLELPRCSGCGAWHWPAVWRCGECGSWEHEWVRQALAGTIYSWTRTWHPFGGTEAFAKPFVTLVVALRDVPCRLTGVLEGPEDGVAIGTAVSGRIATTAFAGGNIPSLRWAIEA